MASRPCSAERAASDVWLVEIVLAITETVLATRTDHVNLE